MKENLKALDGLRGLAAVYVMVHHARLMLTQAYQNGLGLYPEKYEWYDKFMVYFFSLFKFGHEAVIVFFVLSGLVIHLNQAKPSYHFSNFNLLAYLKKRIIRIYPTLLVSFLVCVLTDYFIYLITNQSITTVFSKYQISYFISNLLLIPDTPIWGSNYPIWSLKHEWFFYMLYPFLLWLSTKNKYFPLVFAIVLFVSYVFGFKIILIGEAAYTLLVWLLGAILAVIYYHKNQKIIKFVPYLLLLVVVYPFLSRADKNFPEIDLTFGFIMMGVLALVLNYKIKPINYLLNKIAWLGTFSYSLYLLHMPILNLLKAMVLHFSSNKALPYHLWYVCLAILVVMPTVYFIFYFTERYAINYKKKMPNKIN